MSEKIPSLLQNVAKILDKIFAVIGHTPQEIEEHKKTFFSAALLVSMKNMLSKLSEEKRTEFVSHLQTVNTQNSEDSSKVIEELVNLTSEDQLLSEISETMERLLSEYFVAVQPKLSDDKKSELQQLISTLSV